MKYVFIVLVIAVIAMALINSKKKTGDAEGTGKNTERPRRKNPISENEAGMYNRLAQAFPDKVVLAQVSFGALLTARSRAARNLFDRKMADFVLCDRAFQVLAVIELDDSSHRGREERDADRDSLLTQAGYRVLRYKTIPDVSRVQADVNA